MRPATIIDHPLWPQLRPFFKVENYTREGGTKRPRFRLEVVHMPAELAAKAIRVRVDCCACGNGINPIRERKQPKNKRNDHVGHHLYYACACPLTVNIGCSRGKLAQAEYLKLKSAILAVAP